MHSYIAIYINLVDYFCCIHTIRTIRRRLGVDIVDVGLLYDPATQSIGPTYFMSDGVFHLP